MAHREERGVENLGEPESVIERHRGLIRQRRHLIDHHALPRGIRGGCRVIGLEDSVHQKRITAERICQSFEDVPLVVIDRLTSCVGT